MRQYIKEFWKEIVHKLNPIYKNSGNFPPKNNPLAILYIYAGIILIIATGHKFGESTVQQEIFGD